MQFTSESVEALVEQFMKLPTIGRKTAQRLVSFVLKMPREEVVEMAKALIAVKDNVTRCSVCHNVADTDPCALCASTRRDHTTICVVEESSDVRALESTGEYRGVYHVLGGVISPLDGVGPEDLRIRELAARVDPSFQKTAAGKTASNAHAENAHAENAHAENSEASGNGEQVAEAGAAYDSAAAVKTAERKKVEEVILAVNPNVEGDTTAYYLAQMLRPMGVRITRIARGLPIGGALEYADEATLSRALEGRGDV